MLKLHIKKIETFPLKEYLRRNNDIIQLLFSCNIRSIFLEFTHVEIKKLNLKRVI